MTSPGTSKRTLLRRVVVKAARGDAFFLAGAVSFNVLLAALPFLFLLLALAGFLLPLVEDPRSVLIHFFLDAVPSTDSQSGQVEFADRVVEGLIRDRTGASVLGMILFVWFSTRLVGAIRTVLRRVFEVEASKGIIYGKLFDSGVVIVATALVTVNLAVTVFVRTWGTERVARLGLDANALSLFEMFLVRATGFLAIWVFGLLVYRFLADGRVRWRTAIIAATTMAVLHEGLKFAFGWYVTSVASYSSVYGNLANLAVLLFWVYYTSAAFVLSGVFAHVWCGTEPKIEATA
ncbi:MAG: YihY/virulence factor BrkB family protein [Longimicrobiales bacterium]